VPAPSTPGRLARAAYGAIVVAAVAGVLGPAIRHPFLPSHDDGPYIVWNPVIRAPLAEAVRGAFAIDPLGAFAPLHALSHWVDHAAFGDRAGGYVLVNLALHALNAVLVAVLVLRLGAPAVAAAVAGLIFAVHPVQVEAVVWISQRKTVLSFALLLSALHLWIDYARAPPGARVRPWALSLLVGVGALLTKAVAVVLPVALAAVDAPLRRIRPTRAWILEKLPFLLAAAAIAWVTVLGKHEVAGTASVEGHVRVPGAFGLAWYGGSPLATLLTTATVLPRYLRLLLWPSGLSAVYMPPVHTGPDGEVIGALALAAALAAAGVHLWRASPRLFCWWGLALAGLLPVAQLAPQVTLMNDRYLYLPMVGAAALAGEGIAAALAAVGRRGRVAVVSAAVAAALGLALAARARVPAWRSDLALWSDAVEKTPRSPYAWYNLGRSREAAGDDGGALVAYLRAAALDDRDGDAAVNAGAAHLRRGDLDAAAPHVERGARLLPRSAVAQFDLALLRFLQGRHAEALEALEAARAAGAEACSSEALGGHVLVLAGRPGEGLVRYGEAARLGCADAEAGLYRAYALSLVGDEEAAHAALAEAVESGARVGPTFLDRPTLAPLRAEPRFDALLRRFAARGSGRTP
jgi:hypothetical protein